MTQPLNQVNLRFEFLTEGLVAAGEYETVGLYRAPFPSENPNGWLVMWVPNNGSPCMTYVPFPPRLYQDDPKAISEEPNDYTLKSVSDGVIRIEDYFKKSQKIA